MSRAIDTSPSIVESATRPSGPPKTLRIAVLLGGPSAEREVSLRSGAAAAAALRSLGHVVWKIDPIEDQWTLAPDTDVVFLALHGTYGEDGTVQQRLEELRLLYTGCDPESSRVAFDKALSKQRFMAKGVPTPKYTVINSQSAGWPDGWQPPVVLKPVRQGSSVGLHFVNSLAEFGPALAETLQFDSEALMEEKISGREITVGILADAALPIVEVRPHSGTYNYHSKYTSGATEYICPAQLNEHTTARIQATAVDAFKAVGCRDFARVDMIVKPDGLPMVLEINTLPGLTDTSLLPKAAAAAGIGYAQLCQIIVDLALDRARS